MIVFVNLFPKKRHYKSYHNVINYYTTLNIMFLGYIHAEFFRFPHCNNFIHCVMSIICCIYVLLDLICVSRSLYINEQITNVRQSNVNSLVLPCSRILLVQGEVYCLPCSGWALGFVHTQLVLSRQVKRRLLSGNRISPNMSRNVNIKSPIRVNVCVCLLVCRAR